MGAVKNPQSEPYGPETVAVGMSRVILCKRGPQLYPKWFGQQGEARSPTRSA